MPAMPAPTHSPSADAPTTPTVTVRPGTPADAARVAVFNLRLAAESEGLKLDPSTVERGVRAALLDPAKGSYFVAESRNPDDAGEVVGCLMVTREWSDWRNGDLWWVQSVYVAPDHRRKGAFRALLDHAERAAADAGAVGLRLYVDKANAAARDTYLRLGFEVTHYDLMAKGTK